MEEKNKFVQWMNSLPSRSCIVMAAAGIYLIYLGRNLVSDVMKSGGSENIGFGIAGGAFILVGIFMAVVGGRGILRYGKKQKEAAEEAKREEEAKKEEPPKKMSISERASLAGRIEDENPEEQTEEE